MLVLFDGDFFGVPGSGVDGKWRRTGIQEVRSRIRELRP